MLHTSVQKLHRERIAGGNAMTRNVGWFVRSSYLLRRVIFGFTNAIVRVEKVPEECGDVSQQSVAQDVADKDVVLRLFCHCNGGSLRRKLVWSSSKRGGGACGDHMARSQRHWYRNKRNLALRTPIFNIHTLLIHNLLLRTDSLRIRFQNRKPHPIMTRPISKSLPSNVQEWAATFVEKNCPRHMGKLMIYTVSASIQ